MSEYRYNDFNHVKSWKFREKKKRGTCDPFPSRSQPRDGSGPCSTYRRPFVLLLRTDHGVARYTRRSVGAERLNTERCSVGHSGACTPRPMLPRDFCSRRVRCTCSSFTDPYLRNQFQFLQIYQLKNSLYLMCLCR